MGSQSSPASAAACANASSDGGRPTSDCSARVEWISRGLTALSAVNPRAVHSTRAEQALVGRPPSEEAFAEAAALAAEDCDPIGDLRGPADYKRHLAHELTHRALRRAAARALAS